MSVYGVTVSEKTHTSFLNNVTYNSKKFKNTSHLQARGCFKILWSMNIQYAPRLTERKSQEKKSQDKKSQI